MRILRWVALGLALILAYPAWLGWQIWRQSLSDENQPADAIVVLGAAQYDGDPSPVFRARLDQAAYLYGEGFSKTIIVTGGKQEGDRFTEAEAGEMYLSSAHDIPTDRIVGETNGRTTLESMRAVKTIAEEQEVNSVLLVSDPMHSERIKRIALDLGFEEAHTSPASYIKLNRSRLTKFKELLHEIGSLLAYELLDR